jgi:pimeloyl-ACP methyl ester carboxylesterase
MQAGARPAIPERFAMTAIASEEHFVQKDDVSLFVFRKYIGNPKDKPVLILVHGSGLCALPTFDVRVPGRESEYSMMDVCAGRGFDVWTIDHEGYGKSSRSSSFSNVADGVNDIYAMLPLLERETGRSSYHFYGLSSGSLRAASFAQSRPRHVETLVLDGFVWTGEGAPTLIKRREGLPQYLSSNMRKVDRNSLLAIFHRDMPGSSEDCVAEASVDLQLSYGNQVPSGTFVDMCSKLPLVDPTKIAAPCLMLRGAHDGVATLRDLTNFFSLLPNDDKQLTVLPKAAHIPHLGVSKDRFYHALFGFLDRSGAERRPN